MSEKEWPIRHSLSTVRDKIAQLFQLSFFMTNKQTNSEQNVLFRLTIRVWHFNDFGLKES